MYDLLVSMLNKMSNTACRVFGVRLLKQYFHHFSLCDLLRIAHIRSIQYKCHTKVDRNTGCSVAFIVPVCSVLVVVLFVGI